MLMRSTACHMRPLPRSASSPSVDDLESRLGIKNCALRPIAIAKNHRKALPLVTDHKHQLALERYMTRAVSLRCSLAANSNHSSGVNSSVDPHWRPIERADSLTPERHSGGTDAFTPHEVQGEPTAPTSRKAGNKIDIPQDGKSGLWSIVIPTYNRLPILSKCLQALEEQRDYFDAGIESYEVIVVDDGSTDSTVDVLKGSANCSLGCAQDVHSRASKLNCIASNGDEDEENTTSSNRGESLRLGNGEQDNSRRQEPCACSDGDVLLHRADLFPHVKLLQQSHKGATAARNLGLKYARGAVIVFIDSDLIVSAVFLKAHAGALREAFLEGGDDRAFTYGRVVNTSNFQDPKSEKFKLTDYSAAFFATGNVAISRRLLNQAGRLLGRNGDGPFDNEFSEYGWEDLELGVRLRQCGARLKHAPAAVGYHWHPPFSIEQLPKLIEQERQRGRSGVLFYNKHPTFNVRLMIQMTPFHEFWWFLLTLGGLLNETSLSPILSWLVMTGRCTTAAALVSPILNWYTVQAGKEEMNRLNVR